ncbi:MAG TPA: gamma-glutamylcyclotransferase family protein [Myxococcota bacterium]|nr:gamma-glutamylcyclotransferase family protein [Myxococcota bacterium]
MSRTLVFAYGSNMHAERMRSRVPEAVARGRARLAGHRLVFDKRGRDGSAKANLVPDPAATVWGVVWEIAVAELVSLDPYEGGYERVRLAAETDDGSSLEVEVYVSERRSEDRVPFDWYLEHVLRGARAHGLPEDYVAWLEAVTARPGEPEGGPS